MRKIIKFDESAKSFECSHIRSLIIEAIHDARFVHKLPILPYRPWKIAKHSSIQQDCAVSKRKKSPSTKPIDQLIRTSSGQSPISSLFRMHFLTRMAHRFVFAFHFLVFPFFMTTLLQLDVLLSFSSLWNSIHCFQLNVKSNRRLLWFSCTCYVIGSENSRHFPNQSKQNPKPSRFGHPRFPRLTVWSFLFRVLIGSSWHYPWHDWLLNLCWFCFTTLNRKPFNYDVFINFFLLFLSR